MTENGQKVLENCRAVNLNLEQPKAREISYGWIEEASKAARDRGVMRFLDVGAGIGQSTQRIQKVLQFGDYLLAVDLHADYLKEVQVSLNVPIEVQVLDLGSQPLITKPFGFAVVHFVLDQVSPKDLPMFVKHLAEAVEVGGSILVSYANHLRMGLRCGKELSPFETVQLPDTLEWARGEFVYPQAFEESGLEIQTARDIYGHYCGANTGVRTIRVLNLTRIR